MTRVYLALFQGFLIQQAWQPNLDVAPYVRQLHLIIDSTMGAPAGTGSSHASEVRGISGEGR